MRKSDFRFILLSYVLWRLALFAFVLFSINFLLLQRDHLGGGMNNYLSNPYLWSLANFDGEHYLSIAMRGYKPLQYFFFPAYPILTGFVAKLSTGSMFSYLVSGLLVSHLAFFIGLIGLIRLIRLDFNEKIARLTLILLLLFPTSFYFGAFYTESLFFALSVWSFYFARKGKWLYAGVLGALLTATRIVGLALIPALVVEMWLQNGKPGIGGIRVIGEIWGKRLLGIALIPVGIIVYMVYLSKVTGDPLEFFHSVFIYGEQRSSEFIMLPQVFYRYIFKILLNINYNYFPAVFSTWLEFLVGLGFALLGGLGILGVLRRYRRLKNFEIRESYLIYLLVGYLIPTFSGSFSSLPRYVLVLFPAFIIIAKILSENSKYTRQVYYLLSGTALFIATALFARGYWIA